MVTRNFKGVVVYRDKRMKLLDGMFESVRGVKTTRIRNFSDLTLQIKLIKFFDWEEPCIQKIMGARKAKMHWLKQGQPLCSSLLKHLGWNVSCRSEYQCVVRLPMDSCSQHNFNYVPFRLRDNCP